MGIVMAEAKTSNFIVNITTGKSNGQMIKLLRRWTFKKLKAKHPETDEDWQDEDGNACVMRFRKKAVGAKKAASIFSEIELTKVQENTNATSANLASNFYFPILVNAGEGGTQICVFILEGRRQRNHR